MVDPPVTLPTVSLNMSCKDMKKNFISGGTCPWALTVGVISLDIFMTFWNVMGHMSNANIADTFKLESKALNNIQIICFTLYLKFL